MYTHLHRPVASRPAAVEWKTMEEANMNRVHRWRVEDACPVEVAVPQRQMARQIHRYRPSLLSAHFGQYQRCFKRDISRRREFFL